MEPTRDQQPPLADCAARDNVRLARVLLLQGKNTTLSRHAGSCIPRRSSAWTAPRKGRRPCAVLLRPCGGGSLSGAWSGAPLFFWFPPMPIIITCASCGARTKAPDQLAGKTAKCPKCQATIHVPAESAVKQSPGGDSREALAPVSAHDSAVAEQKPCPFCAEPVRAEAKKCKHCGETLDPAMRAAEEAERGRQRRREEDEDDGRDSRRRRRSRRDDDDDDYRGGRSSAAAASASTTVHVHTNRPFNHAIHLILTICTCGFWFPIWVIAYICHK
jgi:hypothetical protein